MMPPGSRASLADGFLSPATMLGQAFLGLLSLGPTQALAGEFDPMSVVDETIQDGVGVGGIADDFVPAVDGKLGGDHRGAASVALFEDFQEIMAGGGVERLKPPIVEDEKVGAAEIAQDPRMASIAARQREVLEQPGHALVENGPIVPASFMAERGGQPTLSDARRTDSARLS